LGREYVRTIGGRGKVKAEPIIGPPSR